MNKDIKKGVFLFEKDNLSNSNPFFIKYNILNEYVTFYVSYYTKNLRGYNIVTSFDNILFNKKSLVFLNIIPTNLI